MSTGLTFSYKRLTSLDGLILPKKVKGSLQLQRNDLSNLKGAPRKIGEEFWCDNNKLTTLEGGPSEVGWTYVANNNRLTSLEFVASKIGASLLVGNNHLCNLKDIHKIFKDGYIDGAIRLCNNTISSNILGLVLIPRLQKVVFNVEVEDILGGTITKHLFLGDVLDCQEELIQKGFREFARL